MKNLYDFIKESLTSKKYVDGLLINDKNQLLILRRANYMKNFGGKWGVVGGSIEKNESSKDAIIREIKEETGYKLTWNEEHEMKFLTSKVHQNGASTDYWLIKLEIDPEINISREHSKYEWLDINNITEDRKWLPDLYEVLLMLKQPKINECDFATPLNTTGMGNVQPCDSNGNGTEPLPLNKKMKYSKPLIINKKKRKKEITEYNNDKGELQNNE